MPMLTMLRDRLAGVAEPLAGADLVGELGHPVEHLVHRRHDVDAVDLDCARPSGARSATCSTARSSVTLIFSPANIASMRSRSPDSSASCSSSAMRLVGDPVLGVVEVDPDGLDGQPLAAVGVGGEQLAQVAVSASSACWRAARPRRAGTRSGRGVHLPIALCALRHTTITTRRRRRLRSSLSGTLCVDSSAPTSAKRCSQRPGVRTGREQP